MGVWILLAIALLLIVLRFREHYVEISGPGARPSRTAEWLSKIDAEAPIGGNDDDYLTVLQQFYDDIYKPARTANPTVFIKDTQVKQFADSVTRPGIDKEAIRRLSQRDSQWREQDLRQDARKHRLQRQVCSKISRVKTWHHKWQWTKYAHEQKIRMFRQTCERDDCPRESTTLCNNKKSRVEKECPQNKRFTERI